MVTPNQPQPATEQSEAAEVMTTANFLAQQYNIPPEEAARLQTMIEAYALHNQLMQTTTPEQSVNATRNQVQSTLTQGASMPPSDQGLQRPTL